MLNLALEFKYITKDQFQENYDLAVEVSKMISGFIKTL